MGYHAIYAYAWDIAEIGTPAAVDTFAGLGLDTVTLAGSYHAGKFLRPHGRNGKVRFPEDGTVYFRADHSRYGVIKPIANSLLEEHDVFADLAGQSRLAVNAWMVLLHNTPLGMAHPDSVVHNAFGDPYYYNLCPSAPEARAFAIGLVRDITESYPLSGVSLETPGFLPYVHGYHHEFALVQPNVWLENMLGLCFCRHCLEAAGKRGIDAERLKASIATDIAAYLDSDVDYPPDMAEAFWRADLATNRDLQAYLHFRNEVVTSLVSEIRGAVRKDLSIAVIPSVARPSGGAWYEGSELRALAEAAGTIEACFYEPGPDRIRADLFDLRRRLQNAGKLRGILRPAHPDFANRDALIEAVATLRRGGVEELAFYNWGHLRQENLNWIAAALRG